MQLANETIVSLEVVPLKFGVGATEEAGYDLKRLGVTRALILTDKHMKAIGLADRVRKLIQENGMAAEIFDEVAIEPTDTSMEAAAAWVGDGTYDGFVLVIGSSKNRGSKTPVVW